MIDLTESQVMANWGVDNAENPLVSIRCITYNQQDYISAALDGFLMQKTTFPFEIVVHDDASLDKTADIIREYEAKFPKIIKPIYETENQYSKPGNPLGKIVNAALKGKYVAYCEGDDYWIDENKLQMQVDFLENNPEYGMCYTNSYQYIQSKEKLLKVGLAGKYIDFNTLLCGNHIPTLTVCLRRKMLFEYIDDVKPSLQHWKMGDYPMWLYFALFSNVYYFDKVTSVYRVLSNSMSHFNTIEKELKFYENAYEIQSFFVQKYNLKDVRPSKDTYFFRFFQDKIINEHRLEKEIINNFFKYYDLVFTNRKKRLMYKLGFSNKIFFYLFLLARKLNQKLILRLPNNR